MTTPEQNLALDEALFELCEDGGPPSLRFWEPDRAFVVLGYTNRAAAEVNLQECQARSIPVLRRMTGGGTVFRPPASSTIPLSCHCPTPVLFPRSPAPTTMSWGGMARALAPLLPHPAHRPG